LKRYDDFLPNFLVVEPESGVGIDPINEAMMIAGTDWAKEGYKGIIWDTMSATAQAVNMASANTPAFGNHIMLGAGASRIPIPSMGDFRAAQVVADTLREVLFKHELHLLMLGHEGTETKGKGENTEILNAGFALVGQAKISTYGSQFDQYIRLVRQAEQKDGVLQFTRVMAQLQADAIYGAGVRTDLEIEPPALKLVPNTLEMQITWWKELLNMAGIDLASPLSGFLRTAMYSAPKVGKTRLAASLAGLVGPVVYVAWDADSKRLRSVFRSLKDGSYVGGEVAA
jgi:hypothetical protein